MEGLQRNYLAHEYFTHDWRVMPFSDLARWLEDAKLTFAASAHLLDHVDAVNLTEAGQKLLAGISHPLLRESVRDYLVNQQFRRDIFSKGTRRITQFEQIEALRQQKFALMMHPDDIPMKVTGPLGEVGLKEDVYRPIIEGLAKNDFAPKTLANGSSPEAYWVPTIQIIQAAIVLTGAGYALPRRSRLDRRKPGQLR